MALITRTTVIKRADQLAEGDIIPGGDAVNGHVVLCVKSKMDPMLGLVILVVVREAPRYREDDSHYEGRDYIFRTYDRIHVEA